MDGMSEVSAKKKPGVFRYSPGVMVLTLYVFLTLYTIGMVSLGDGQYAHCYFDGVNMAYVFAGVAFVWIGGASIILIGSAFVMYLRKCVPDWECYLWSTLTLPFLLYSMALIRGARCSGFGAMTMADAMAAFAGNGDWQLGVINFSLVLSAIAGLMGIIWSISRHRVR